MSVDQAPTISPGQTEKRTWLETVLKIQLAGGGSPQSGVEEIEDVRGLAQDRLKDAVIGIKLLGEAGAGFSQTAKDIAALILAKKYEEAMVALNSLEDQIAAAKRDARLLEAEEGASGRVQYRKLQLQWRQAQTKTNDRLNEFSKAALAHPEISTDPLFEDVQKALADLSKAVPSFGTELDELLDKMDSPVSSEMREALKDRARELIDEYQAELESADTLNALQEIAEEEFSSINLVEELHGVLGQISTALAA